MKTHMKQDGALPRTPEDLERKYNLGKRIKELADLVALMAGGVLSLKKVRGLQPPEEDTEAANKEYVDQEAEKAKSQANQNLQDHTGNKNNPHSVTAAQVGARPDTWMPTASDVGAASKVHTHAASDVTSGTMPIERGGTNADTAAGARQNINVIGLNPVTASANDTPDVWKAFGTGIAYFNKADCIVDQPTKNGLIENKVYNNTVLQEWFVRGSSPRKLIRTGQASSGWNSSWVDVSIAGQTDYVTATGTSGVWTYWKFSSGLCIAMGTPTVTWSTQTQMIAGQYRSTASLDLSGIFTAVMGGTCSNVHRYVNCFVSPSGNATPELWATTAAVAGNSLYSNKPIVVLFGKWK